MQVLSGDIGGTKTRMALIECATEGFSVKHEQVFDSNKYERLEQILTTFLQRTHATPSVAGFGIAGPVRDHQCEATNLPWRIDAKSVQGELDIDYVHLSNDLEATTWGINQLGQNDLYTLNAGREDQQGNISVIAAGTGLGEAGACRCGDALLHPFASEGGHTDFAPTTELEFALFQYLSQQHGGHVSWERVASGLGIENIYRFLCHFKGVDTPVWLQEKLHKGQAAAAISKAADEGRCPLCEKTMNLFVRLYGREAGNHALKIMATGGVYLGGGIAPKIIDRLKEPSFLNAFFAKGRMQSLMQSMPVHVILDDKAALYGAALAAAHALGKR
jgi:glucokinase